MQVIRRAGFAKLQSPIPVRRQLFAMWFRNTAFRSQHGNGVLYIVPTPIGNLQDISLRALDVLSSVSLLFAEDTRSARKLLHAHPVLHPSHPRGTRPPRQVHVTNPHAGATIRELPERDSNPGALQVVSCHQHNSTERVPLLLSALHAGLQVAYVCEAGTPGLSDPGALLVQAARAAGYTVTALPGPCAATTALSASGWDIHGHYEGMRMGMGMGRAQAASAGSSGSAASCGFLFLGFLPSSQPARAAMLQAVAAPFAGLVVCLYESPARVRDTLQELARACEGGREMEKGALGEAAASMAAAEPLPPSLQRKARRQARDEAKLRAALPGLPLYAPTSVVTQVDGSRRRPVFLARELTKVHEQCVHYPSIQAACAAVQAGLVPALGEFTLLLGPVQEQ